MTILGAKLFGDISIFENQKECVLSIGNFDGVHLGHTSMLKKMREENPTLPIVALTFHPHPMRVLTPENPKLLITTLDERIELLQKNGVDLVVVQEFDRVFAAKSAHDFCSEFVEAKFNLQKLYLGYDFNFGKNRQGNFEFLIQYGKEKGWDVIQCESFILDGESVSSTRIRDAVQSGDMDAAAYLLGRPFSLSGEIVRGEQLGRKIGFPTANIAWENELTPRLGVYACEIKLVGDNRTLQGVMNCGVRPTVGGGLGKQIETHIFEFDEEIYGVRATYLIKKFLRPEQKFSGLDALKAQITKDVQFAKAYFESAYAPTIPT